MPNIKSALKRMKTSRQSRLENSQKRSRLRNAIKKVRNAETLEEAKKSLTHAVSLLDKYSGDGILHSRTAARYKSRLMRHIKNMEES
ncbi:MAG: 30S ribosomal protein S20 [Candidatus Glassbacteria bacterium]